MFRMKTLGNKILVTFLTLIIVQLIAYGALTYWFDARTFSEQLSNANSLTVNQMTTTLEDQIHTIENLGSQLASNAVVRETLLSPFESSETGILSLFGSFKQAWPQIDNLYLYNLARDQIRLADYDVSLPDPQLKDYEDEETSIQYGTVISGDLQTPLAVVSYMRLVKDESGEPAGWIRLDHNLYQNKFLKDLFEDERMFMILQPTGRVLYTNRPDRIDIMLISRLLRQTSPDASFMTDVNGKTSLLSYSRSEATKWMSVLIMPSNALDKALFQSRYFTIGFIGFNIALAFAASLYISRRITKPLRVLHQFIAKIGLGDFTTRVPVVSMDEIGFLGRRINDMVSQIEMLVNQVYLAERDEQLTRHQALRSQINPHFLYNTLESVDALVLKGEKLMAHQVIESLSVMLRYALKAKNQVTLQQELKHIEAYLQIQRIKYRDQFEVRIDVREEHQAVMMPPLVLQPLLENAFKHGFFRKEGINRLAIRSEADPDANRLELRVIDNGAGAELEGLPENDRANDSIGLQNVDQRIRMQFGEGYGLHIASLPGRWFKATVVLPLKWSEKNP